MKKRINTLRALVAAIGFVGATTAQAALVLYYDFEGDSTAAGDVNDQSGNSRDGSAVSAGTGSIAIDGTTTVAANVTGSSSLALSGDSGSAANSGWVDADGYTGIAGSAARTVSAWIKADNLDQDQTIFSYGDDGPDGGKFLFRLDESGSSGDYSLRIETSGSFLLGNTAGIDDGAWQHVAVVYDGTNATLYLNGVSDGTGALNVNTTLVNNVRIGANSEDGSTNSGERNFNGNIDDVAFFDTALSASEIAGLADGTFTPLTVPEPSGAVLFGLGALVLLHRRRKQDAGCPL